MKPLVHFGLGCVAAAMVLSPSLSAAPPAAPEVRVVQAFPDELIREVVVREIVRERCAGDVAAKLLNEVLRSRAQSGGATFENLASLSGSRSKSGITSQNARATSGLANLGQITDIIAACSTVTANLINTVSDSEARSGDAEARNEIDSKPLETVSSRDIPTSTATRTAFGRR